MERQTEHRTAKGPLIGYAIGLENKSLQVDCFGSPYEVLEELRSRGLVFREIGHHQEGERAGEGGSGGHSIGDDELRRVCFRMGISISITRKR